MPRAKAKPEPEETELTPSDFARYYELKAQIAELTKEYEPLEKAIKALDPFEMEKVEIDGHDYHINRWNQIGALNTAEFLKRFPIEDFPELTTPTPNIEEIAKLAPVEEYPDLWNRVPDAAKLKEAIANKDYGLSETDKDTLFKQSAYLKIERSK